MRVDRLINLRGEQEVFLSLQDQKSKALNLHRALRLPTAPKNASLDRGKRRRIET